MELLERLRLRTQQANNTAQVDCGGLGVLTVQALPIRECEALAAGPDRDRALLYAACRQLQTAGEQLRREGRLFRPDEIMQLVSDQEARAGAEAVGRLSGLDMITDGEPKEEPEAETDPEIDPEADPEAKPEPEPETVPPAQAAGPAKGETIETHEKTAFSKIPDSETKSDKILPPFVQDSLPSEPDQGLASGKKTIKVRLQPVQNFGKQATKIRQNFDNPPEVGQVSRESRGVSGGPGDRPDSLPGRIAPPKTAVNRPVYGAERSPRSPKKESEQGGETQQHAKIKSNSPAAETDGLHEIKSDSAEAVHGHKTEFAPREGGRLHEIKSEFPAQERYELHETKSELGKGLHECKSEFPARKRDGLHESKSELREGVPLTETEPPDQERPRSPVTEDLAREVARVIVEGLRRAAGAR